MRLTHPAPIPIIRPDIIDVISSISSFGGCLPGRKTRHFFLPESRRGGGEYRDSDTRKVLYQACR